jgi:hypothetical protein
MEFSIDHRDKIPELLNSLGLVGWGVEVGVLNGENADNILNWWDGERLYLVDPFGTVNHDKYIDRCAEADMVQAARRTMEVSNNHFPRAPILMLTSMQAVTLFDDGSLDFVYLDAQHHKEAVKEDINYWWPKIKNGGILAGHDYKNDIRPGVFVCEVKEVVDQFCLDHKLELTVTKEDVPSWIVRK